MHFDTTINLGNLLVAASFIFFGIIAWRDLTWRIKNLEIWRTEHMIDSDARDLILTRLDRIIVFIDRDNIRKKAEWRER